MKTICISVRVPEKMLEDLQKARDIIGATSYSDLLRDAIRHYLASLSLLSARAERLKRSDTLSPAAS